LSTEVQTIENRLSTRSPALFASVSVFVGEAIALAQSKIMMGVPLPAEQREEWESVEHNESTYRRQPSTQIHFFVFVYQMREELIALNSYLLAKTAITEDRIWSKHMNTLVGTTLSASRMEPESLLFGIAAQALKNQSSLKDTAISITTEIEKFEEQFLSSTISQKRVMPLRGIALTESIHLSPQLSIEKLSSEEVKELLNRGVVTPNFMDSLGDFIHNAPTVAVVSRFNLPKVLGQSPDEGSRQLAVDQISEIISQLDQDEKRALDLLTLIHDAPIVPLAVIMLGEGIAANGYSIQRLGTIDSWILERKDFSGESANSLIQYWKTISQSSKSLRAINIAIRRYSDAMTRSSLDDRLLDLMICAESLYFNEDGEQSELKHRLSYRAALLLGTSPEEKKQIYGFMNSAYNKRSKVVHGKVHTTRRTEAIELEAIIKQLSGYLQKTILKMLELSASRHPNKTLIDWTDLMFQ
jgi:hypothetical protein